MRMSKKEIFALLFMFAQTLYSQEYNNRVYSYNTEKMSYFKYENIKIFATLKNISEVENKTPEQLAQSILSCSSREWDIKNTLGGAENVAEKTKKEYDKIKSMDKEKNFLELISKVEFDIDNIRTAIVKIYYFSETFPKPQVGIFVMQQYNGVWYKTNTRQVNNIALTIMRLKPDILDDLINENYSSVHLRQIKQNITTNGILDFNKLSVEFDRLSEIDDPILTNIKDEYSIF